MLTLENINNAINGLALAFAINGSCYGSFWLFALTLKSFFSVLFFFFTAMMLKLLLTLKQKTSACTYIQTFIVLPWTILNFHHRVGQSKWYLMNRLYKFDQETEENYFLLIFCIPFFIIFNVILEKHDCVQSSNICQKF